MEQLIESFQAYGIDIGLFSSTDTKQTTKIKESIIGYFRRINKNAEMFTSDSKEYNITKNNWLPGGIMGMITGDIGKYIQHNEIVVDSLGQWSAIIL